MQHFVDKARGHHKRQQYHDAIRCFDKAIARAPSARLFDERADCYARLGQYDTALKDAKASIQHASTDPVGYLRAGGLLLKMKKKDVALEVMSYGLKRVQHSGKLYEV